MDRDQTDPDVVLDILWERMRAQERADRLSQVVQDTVRDARVAEALTGEPSGAGSS